MTNVRMSLLSSEIASQLKRKTTDALIKHCSFKFAALNGVYAECVLQQRWPAHFDNRPIRTLAPALCYRSRSTDTRVALWVGTRSMCGPFMAR
jgi:hypothetical protein